MRSREQGRRAIIAAALWLVPAMAQAAGPGMTPGKWQITTRIEAMDMPDMPAGAMQGMLGRPMTNSICVKPADAAAGPASMIGKDSNNCRTTRLDSGPGRIDAELQCKGPPAQTITISGTFSADAYDIRSRMAGSGMITSTRATGRRIGPC